MSILTPDATKFLEKLHQMYDKERKELLLARKNRPIGFLNSPQNGHSWTVAKAPRDLQTRHVEITGPVDKKMMINALNSGADCFMADFEDALSPTWNNVLEGQQNLIDAIEGTLFFTSAEGKEYKLNEKRATLIVRPRGWHLEEKNLGMSASLVDFGLYFFHNAKRLLAKGSGPYFYLPKMESHLEARLWNKVFVTAEEYLGIPKGTIRATVLIETIPAAFEMEEILYELREYVLGLNAGRWDYIFSIIKKFQNKQDFIFPDRSQITMTVPFMRAYTELLIKTCHKRGAYAMGGMAAFVPSRKNEEVNKIALQKVTEDKLRESKDGFNGTWVAHPDLVPVAKKIFEEAKPEPRRDEVHVTQEQLLDFTVPGGTITEQSLRQNISVCLHYLDAWLQGQGAVALFNLMEDTATAEIARAQLWQWIHHNAKLSDGRSIDTPLYRQLAAEEFAKIPPSDTLTIAYKELDTLVTNPHFEEFLTLALYKYL